MSENDPESIVDTPVYTKDEEYIGIIQDIDGKNGNLIIKGKLELRKFSVPRTMVVDSANINNEVILDMTQDDLFNYEI
jgi:PRC-barrel domain